MKEILQPKDYVRSGWEFLGVEMAFLFRGRDHAVTVPLPSRPRPFERRDP